MNFEREDDLLRELVGADSRQILGSAAFRDGFEAARERLSRLASLADLSSQDRVDRDRLDSYFGFAFGPGGFLSKAGAAQCLRDRFERVAALAPHLVDDPPALARLGREAAILSALAQARFASGRPSQEERALARAAEAADRTVRLFSQFVSGAHAVDMQTFKGLRALWAGADLIEIVANETPKRPLLAAVGFLLARAGDHLADFSGASAFDSLVASSLGDLRADLWEVALDRQGDPAQVTLASLEKDDREIEELLALLSAKALKGEVRARLVAHVWSLSASLRAADASRRAAQLAAASLATLADGLAEDSGSAAR